MMIQKIALANGRITVSYRAQSSIGISIMVLLCIQARDFHFNVKYLHIFVFSVVMHQRFH